MYKLKVIQIIITNVHHHVAYIRHSPRGRKVTKTGKNGASCDAIPFSASAATPVNTRLARLSQTSRLV